MVTPSTQHPNKSPFSFTDYIATTPYLPQPEEGTNGLLCLEPMRFADWLGAKAGEYVMLAARTVIPVDGLSDVVGAIFAAIPRIVTLALGALSYVGTLLLLYVTFPLWTPIAPLAVLGLAELYNQERANTNEAGRSRTPSTASSGVPEGYVKVPVDVNGNDDPNVANIKSSDNKKVTNNPNQNEIRATDRKGDADDEREIGGLFD